MKFRRTIEAEIKNGLDNYKSPLMVLGARQIGKTTTIKNILEKQKINYVYLNFEENEELKLLFESNLDVSRIVKEIEFMHNITNLELIFFDEIQAFSKAITSLKYFCENPIVKVISSGSNLGITIFSEEFSFPVGKVKILEMYPMSFFEYLDNSNEQNFLAFLKDAYQNRQISDAMHKKALDLFDKYLLVGGMPACIEELLLSENLNEVIEINKQLFNSYKLDIRKYAKPKDILRIGKIYDLTNTMLLNENQKFKVSAVDKKGYRVLDYAFEWLRESKVIIPIYKISNRQPNIPLKAHVKDNEFKLAYSDTSLLINNFDYSYFQSLQNNDRIYTGVILENYVATVLRRKFSTLYYYHYKEAEIDFLVQYEGELIPIEVKAGKNNPAKSLQFFIDKNEISKAYKINRSNFYQKDKVLSVPVYLLDCLFWVRLIFYLCTIIMIEY